MPTSESKGRFFNKTNRFESIRIANWNALTRTTTTSPDGKQVIARVPAAARRYAPAAMAARLAADLRPSADGSAVHASLVAGGG